VRGSVINRDRKLKGEMFVTAEVPDAQRTLLQLPEKALVLSGGSYHVFVEESQGRYRWSEVKVEGVRDGVAGVVSGVDFGQKVVVEGTLLLHRLYLQLAGGAPA
jgi:cobalt-zinc-cadmium efflux system membrane fusion protein